MDHVTAVPGPRGRAAGRLADGAPVVPDRVDGAAMTVDVALGRVDDPGVSELLATHLAHMRAITPAGFVFAFDAGALAAPHVSLFTARADGELVGCGALSQLDAERGEIKSMHV